MPAVAFAAWQLEFIAVRFEQRAFVAARLGFGLVAVTRACRFAARAACAIGCIWRLIARLRGRRKVTMCAGIVLLQALTAAATAEAVAALARARLVGRAWQGVAIGIYGPQVGFAQSVSLRVGFGRWVCQSCRRRCSG